MKQNIQKKKTAIFAIGLAVGFVMLFAGMTTVNASTIYDSDTNTIILKDGVNTLSSIYAETNDPSILSYDSGTNTYTLSAFISGEDGIIAHLSLQNATLIFNNTADNQYFIKTWADLAIENMTIKAADPSYPWLIWAYSRYTDYSLKITDSDISGGQIQGSPLGYREPRIPTVIKNNRFHDITIDTTDTGNAIFKGAGYSFALEISLKAAVNGYIYNNIFNNIHITAPLGNLAPGILRIRGNSTGLVVDKIYISNSSIYPTYGGMTFIYGTTVNNPVIISNFEIKDIAGPGLAGKEYGNVKYKNGTITNISKYGIFLYHSADSYGNTKYWVRDITIDGAGSGIVSNANTDLTADIYNVKINNVNTAFITGLYSLSKFYITNSIATNYTTLYSVYYNSEGDIRDYQLTDIYVKDLNGNPIANANITITAENADVADYSINRNLKTLTQTITLSNGRTPLPAEDPTNTVALLNLRVTPSHIRGVSQIEKSDYTYTITAEKNGKTATVTGIDPDETWYRPDPNIPTKTITITLDTSQPTQSILGDINNDGKVNANDFISLISKWLKSAISPFDLNSDGIINTRDLGIMMSNWKE